MKSFHLHLVSDSTGETNLAVARAGLVQFDEVEPIEHVWSMIRSDRQVMKVVAGIEGLLQLLHARHEHVVRGAVVRGFHGERVRHGVVVDQQARGLAHALGHGLEDGAPRLEGGLLHHVRELDARREEDLAPIGPGTPRDLRRRA